MLKLSSPRLRCWSIQVFVCWLNDWTSWMSCADRNGCHGFHRSEYFRCLLYNQVALPYAFRPAFSTPTTCLWAFVLVGSGVQVRSGCWGSIGSSLGVSSGGGAPGTLSKSRSLIYSLSMAFRCPYCSHTMMAQGDSSRQVVESHWVIALHLSILGDIVDSELPVGSRWIISFWR